MDKKQGNIKISVVSILGVLFFTVLSGLIPFASLILPVVASAITAYLYIRCGKTALAINIVLTIGVMLFLTKEVESLFVAALCLLPGIVSGIMICKKREYYSTLGWTSLTFSLIFILIMFVAGYGVQNGIGGIIDGSFENMKNALLQAVPKEEIGKIEDALNYSLSYTKSMLPSVVVLLSIFGGYIHLVLVRLLANKISKINYNYVPLDMHKIPRNMSYMYFALTIFLIFLGFESKTGIIVNNIVVIIDSVMAFCGFSFIESRFKGKLKYGIARAAIYFGAFMIANSFLVQILSLIGMLDSFRNYRGITKIGE